jgi:hypothetical protein
MASLVRTYDSPISFTAFNESCSLRHSNLSLSDKFQPDTISLDTRQALMHDDRKFNSRFPNHSYLYSVLLFRILRIDTETNGARAFSGLDKRGIFIRSRLV